MQTTLARELEDAGKDSQGEYAAVAYSTESRSAIHSGQTGKEKEGVRMTQSTLTVFPRFVSSARPKVIWRMPLR